MAKKKKRLTNPDEVYKILRETNACLIRAYKSDKTYHFRRPGADEFPDVAVEAVQSLRDNEQVKNVWMPDHYAAQGWQGLGAIKDTVMVYAAPGEVRELNRAAKAKREAAEQETENKVARQQEKVVRELCQAMGVEFRAELIGPVGKIISRIKCE